MSLHAPNRFASNRVGRTTYSSLLWRRLKLYRNVLPGTLFMNSRCPKRSAVNDLTSRRAASNKFRRKWNSHVLVREMCAHYHGFFILCYQSFRIALGLSTPNSVVEGKLRDALHSLRVSVFFSCSNSSVSLVKTSFIEFGMVNQRILLRILYCLMSVLGRYLPKKWAIPAFIQHYTTPVI